jgi:predicted RNA-binding protein (TIGR00451 family)
MKGLFHKLEISSTSDVGKRDRKLINKELGREVLEKHRECKVHKCRNKSSVLSLDGMPILFLYRKRYFPTIRHLEDIGMKWAVVYLDDGAVGPISRGADVMAPGIHRYREMVEGDFGAGDAVVVRIVGGDVIAVGEALVGLSEIDKGQAGAAVEIHHKINDALYNWRPE